MGVLRYLAKRRFNHIDVISTLFFAYTVSETRSWWLSALVFLIGLIVSVLAERATGEGQQ